MLADDLAFFGNSNLLFIAHDLLGKATVYVVSFSPPQRIHLHAPNLVSGTAFVRVQQKIVPALKNACLDVLCFSVTTVPSDWQNIKNPKF